VRTVQMTHATHPTDSDGRNGTLGLSTRHPFDERPHIHTPPNHKSTFRDASHATCHAHAPQAALQSDADNCAPACEARSLTRTRRVIKSSPSQQGAGRARAQARGGRATRARIFPRPVDHTLAASDVGSGVDEPRIERDLSRPPPEAPIPASHGLPAAAHTMNPTNLDRPARYLWCHPAMARRRSRP